MRFEHFLGQAREQGLTPRVTRVEYYSIYFPVVQAMGALKEGEAGICKYAALAPVEDMQVLSCYVPLIYELCREFPELKPREVGDLVRGLVGIHASRNEQEQRIAPTVPVIVAS